MTLLLKLAWRNIWRNSRRSLLTILAVCFATFLSVVMRGMQVGTYDSMIKNMVQMFTGYVQVQRIGYQKNPSLHLCFPYDDSLASLIAHEPGVSGVAPRIHADGLVSKGEQSMGGMIIGILPDAERLVTKIPTRIVDGAFLSSDSTHEIVVGHKMLKNLNARIGDRVVILTQGFDGSLGNMAYTIVGSLRMGSQEFDAMAVFMGLSDARELLGMSNQVHSLALSLDDLAGIPQVKETLGSGVAARKLAVLRWDEVSPEMMQHIELDNISGILLLGILIIIVAFGILNAVLMSVTERFREFGVVLSMGMGNKALVVLVLFETLFITCVGVILGDILAWCVNYYIVLNPIVIGGMESIEEMLGMEWRLMSTVRPSVFINSSLAVLVISLCSCLYPAYKVMKLEPLKGLRFT